MILITGASLSIATAAAPVLALGNRQVPWQAQPLRIVLPGVLKACQAELFLLWRACRGWPGNPGSLSTSPWTEETAPGANDCRAMLWPDQVARTLHSLAQQPHHQVVEDPTPMPAAGAF